MNLMYAWLITPTKQFVLSGGSGIQTNASNPASMLLTSYARHRTWVGYFLSCRRINDVDALQKTAPETNIDVLSLAVDVVKRLHGRFDPEHGGFGGAPKFPSPAQTTHLLARYAAYHLNNPNVSSEDRQSAEKARDMAVFTMVKIYNGGIRDVVGGGFSR